MWWPSTESWHLYLNGSHVYVRRRTGLPGRRRWEAGPTQPAQPFAHPADVARALDAALTSAARGAALHVVLGSVWTRFSVLAQAQGLRTPKEYQTVALAHFQQQLGLPAMEWVATAAMGQTPIVVAVLKKSLWDAISACAAQRTLRVATMQPIASLANDHIARQTLDPVDILLVREADALTTWVGSPEGYRAAQAMPFDGSDTTLEAEQKRLSLAFGVPLERMKIARIQLPSDASSWQPHFLDCVA